MLIDDRNYEMMDDSIRALRLLSIAGSLESITLSLMDFKAVRVHGHEKIA